jgi:mono/diheme cytochrome c family protein
MKIMITVALSILILGCNSKNKKPQAVVNTNNLPTQVFTIDITKDTMLTTANGAIINLPQGTLKSDSNRVELELKEAYSLQQMLLAGLNTASSGNLLSSNGMFYLNAKGDAKVTIATPIKMKIPTTAVNDSIKLFTGDENNNNIDWTKPIPFKVKTVPDSLRDGKSLFANNCASCHNIFKDGTGPALANITKKRTKDYLRRFTNNWQELVASGDCIAIKAIQWAPTIMNKFNFKDAEIDAIYDYISFDDTAPFVDDGTKARQDSCEKYKRETLKKDSLLNAKKKLLKKNNKSVTITDTSSVSITNDAMPNNTNGPNSNAIIDYVEPIPKQAEYYEISIDKFGWFNLDIFMKDLPNVKDCELFVNVNEAYKDFVNVFLIVPNYKVMVEGGIENNQYVFYTKDGKLPLPIGEQAYILTLGEKEGKFMYAKLPFTIQQSQTLSLTIETSTVHSFNADIKRMGWTDLNIKAAASKNAEPINAIDIEIKQIESLKPTSDCECVGKPIDTLKKTKPVQLKSNDY